MSGLLTINFRDVSKGLVVAVLVVILGAFQQALTVHGLDFALYDWSSILDVAWKAAFAYLAKNFFSDSEGRVLGKIG